MEQLTLNESIYNPYLHEATKECIICMEQFREDVKVTALPCDERHYFHSECILSWSERYRNCPLCKKPYDLKDIKKFNKKFVITSSDDGTVKLWDVKTGEVFFY